MTTLPPAATPPVFLESLATDTAQRQLESMEQSRMVVHPPPLRPSHDEQLTSQPAASREDTSSTLASQRPPVPATLGASPSSMIQSPPQYHMQPKAFNDPQAPRPSQERPASLSFPDAPSAELAPIQPRRENILAGPNRTLPSLSSVTDGLKAPPEPAPLTQWPSLNPYSAFYAPSYAQPTEAPSVERTAASPECFSRRSASVSLDDPDVRMAAEALGDLRADFVSSPPNRSTPLPSTPRDHRMATASPRDSASDQQRPEPLLSLITASHPLVATTIEGATSVYHQSKNFSPHLKTGAEYIEDCLSPVAKVVGNVGRKTGVEGGVRWILAGVKKNGRKHQSGSDLEGGEGGSHKRRKAKLSDKEKEAFDRSFPETVIRGSERRASASTIDTLPAYDDLRSPAYSEAVDSERGQDPARRGSGESPAWKTRIVVSTSSFGIAMRAESLRSLKYCLKQLRYANSCVTDLTTKLQDVIDQHDEVKTRNGEDLDGASSSQPPPSDHQTNLLDQMDYYKTGIALKVKWAISELSQHTGNALPENVRNLIREQINGLPQRWRAQALKEATSEEGTENGAGTDNEMASARRVLLLGKECLRTMTRISDLIDRTIQSAEEWCTVLSKENPDGTEANPNNITAAPSPAMWATSEPQLPTPAGTGDDTHMTG